jgi:hypothetical protein
MSMITLIASTWWPPILQTAIIEGPSRIAMVENFAFMTAKGQDLVPELQKEAKRTWKDHLQPTESA